MYSKTRNGSARGSRTCILHSAWPTSGAARQKWTGLVVTSFCSVPIALGKVGVFQCRQVGANVLIGHSSRRVIRLQCMTVVGDTVALLLTREGGGSEQVRAFVLSCNFKFGHNCSPEYRSNAMPRRRNRQLETADMRQGASRCTLATKISGIIRICRATMRAALTILPSAPSAKRSLGR